MFCEEPQSENCHTLHRIKLCAVSHFDHGKTLKRCFWILVKGLKKRATVHTERVNSSLLELLIAVKK